MNLCVRCYVTDGLDHIPASYIVHGESCCEAHMRHLTRTEHRPPLNGHQISEELRALLNQPNGERKQ